MESWSSYTRCLRASVSSNPGCPTNNTYSFIRVAVPLSILPFTNSNKRYTVIFHQIPTLNGSPLTNIYSCIVTSTNSRESASRGRPAALSTKTQSPSPVSTGTARFVGLGTSSQTGRPRRWRRRLNTITRRRSTGGGGRRSPEQNMETKSSQGACPHQSKDK